MLEERLMQRLQEDVLNLAEQDETASVLHTKVRFYLEDFFIIIVLGVETLGCGPRVYQISHPLIIFLGSLLRVMSMSLLCR
jgi:hypothetical protein